MAGFRRVRLARAWVTRDERETVVRNTGIVLTSRCILAFFALLVFSLGVGWSSRPGGDVNGGYVALPLVVGPGCYLLWMFGEHQLIRLTTWGLVVENMFVRHEFAWLVAPTIYYARGVRVGVPDGSFASSRAFQFSPGVPFSGFDGHRSMVGLLQGERERIRARFPIVTSDDAPVAGYRARLQLPKPWLILVAPAAVEGIYALGVALGAPSRNKVCIAASLIALCVCAAGWGAYAAVRQRKTNARRRARAKSSSHY